jgi:hypothetical protein
MGGVGGGGYRYVMEGTLEGVDPGNRDFLGARNGYE